MEELFIIAHILGAVQGFFLATVLAGGRRASLANRLLAITMLAFSIDLAMAAYHATGYDLRVPHLIGIDFPLAFLYGPLLLLYTRTLSRGEQSFRRAYWWHFLPFVLLVLALVPFYLQEAAAKLLILGNSAPSPWAEPLSVVNHLKLVSAALYIVAILYELRSHRRNMRASRSSTDRMNLNWLRNLVVAMVALTTMALAMHLLSMSDRPPAMGLDPSSPYDDYMLLGLAVLVYAIGYMGLRQPEIFDGRRHALNGLSGASGAEGEATPVVPAQDEREETGRSERRPYARSGMDADSAFRYEQALLAAMEIHKPYRRGDLTLQELADVTGISPHNLTEVINTRLEQNFYDFVNGYRVNEVRARLADPTFAHLTVLAIGLEAGFNSKSTFNAVFKKHTKMTPSQYRAATARPVHPVG